MDKLSNNAHALGGRMSAQHGCQQQSGLSRGARVVDVSVASLLATCKFDFVHFPGEAVHVMHTRRYDIMDDYGNCGWQVVEVLRAVALRQAWPARRAGGRPLSVRAATRQVYTVALARLHVRHQRGVLQWSH